MQAIQTELLPGQPLDESLVAQVLAAIADIDPQAQAQAASEVEALCQQERFQEAAAMAAILSACQPTNSRYSYLAAICQQHLGRPDLAAALYALSLLGAHPTASACYRVGECHAALGDWEKAIEAFDTSIEMHRDEDEVAGHAVFDLAQVAKAHAQAQLGA
jgi:tetratricopeptide (TPR) repeat protein